jgi:hypothetical protein
MILLLPTSAASNCWRNSLVSAIILADAKAGRIEISPLHLGDGATNDARTDLGISRKLADAISPTHGAGRADVPRRLGLGSRRGPPSPLDMKSSRMLDRAHAKAKAVIHALPDWSRLTSGFLTEGRAGRAPRATPESLGARPMRSRAPLSKTRPFVRTCLCLPGNFIQFLNRRLGPVHTVASACRGVRAHQKISPDKPNCMSKIAG